MPDPDLLRPDASDCDPFLFASVGEDKNGYLVTVLSTFARLGLDPRKEASDLAAPSRSASCERLDRLLTGFLDVPALRREHGATADRLSSLLPGRLRSRVNMQGQEGTTAGLPSKPGMSIFQLLIILLVLVQILYFGLSGAAE